MAKFRVDDDGDILVGLRNGIICAAALWVAALVAYITLF